MSEAPRLFRLERDVDHTGVSGVGVVAHGVLWPDGTVTLRWVSERPSTVNWACLDDARHVHGHGGDTRFVFDDNMLPGLPQADWQSAWTELTGYVADADEHRDPIDAGHLLAYMRELRGKAVAPVKAWLKAREHQGHDDA